MKIIKDIRYIYQRNIEKINQKQNDGRFVAMFHQIENDANGWYDNQYSISVDSFIEFIEDIQKMGYIIVSPYDIMVNDGKKKVVLTFDDSFEGVYKYVYPLLKEKKIPFVVFISVCKLRENGYINTEMLVEMTKNYSECYIGSHGVTHCNLRHVSKRKCQEEIVQSKLILERIIEKKVELFAYPYGNIDAVGYRERCIAEKNYKLVFGTLQTGVTVKTRKDYIPRYNINENYVNASFWKDIF